MAEHVTDVRTGYTGLGTLVNAASRSNVERVVMTPTALSLAVLCGIVAAKGPNVDHRKAAV